MCKNTLYNKFFLDLNEIKYSFFLDKREWKEYYLYNNKV